MRKSFFQFYTANFNGKNSQYENKNVTRQFRKQIRHRIFIQCRIIALGFTSFTLSGLKQT